MDSGLSSVSRAVLSLSSLAMRRATVEAAVFGGAPEAGARLVEAMVMRARQGDSGARTACEAMASAIAHRRAGGDVAGLERIGAAAREAGLVAAAALADDVGAHKGLARGGRLHEIGIAEDLFFAETPFVWMRFDHGGCHTTVMFEPWLAHRRVAAIGGALQMVDRLAKHGSPRFIRRLLRVRSMRARDAIAIAARRPSTPAIALEVALADRWFAHAAVREALALNPFTPTWLVLAILPTLASRHIRHVRDSGDAHPRAMELAAHLLDRIADSARVLACAP